MVEPQELTMLDDLKTLEVPEVDAFVEMVERVAFAGKLNRLTQLWLGKLTYIAGVFYGYQPSEFRELVLSRTGTQLPSANKLMAWAKVYDQHCRVWGFAPQLVAQWPETKVLASLKAATRTDALTILTGREHLSAPKLKPPRKPQVFGPFLLGNLTGHRWKKDEVQRCQADFARENMEDFAAYAKEWIKDARAATKRARHKTAKASSVYWEQVKERRAARRKARESQET